MSIADKLNVLIDGKQQCVNAINNKIDYNKYNIKSKWNDLANEVRRLGFEEGTIQTITDDNVAYSKDLPNGTLPKGFLEKVGGMSYVSENLSPQATTQPISTGFLNTTQGTFGSITSGKTYTFSLVYNSTINTSLVVSIRTMSTADGTGSNLGSIGNIALTNGTRTSITFTATNTGYIGFSGSGLDATDTITDITLNVGSSDLGYTAYYEGIRDSKVSEVVSYGANLFKPENVSSNMVDAVIIPNGIRIIMKQEGFTYIVMRFYDIKYLIGRVIKIIGQITSSSDNEGTIHVRAYDKNGTQIQNLLWYNQSVANNTGYLVTTTGTLHKDTEFISVVLYANVKSDTGQIGDYVDYTNVYIGASEQETYTPYVPPTTELIVPEEIKNLDWYGLGISKEYHNYIDLQTRKGYEVVKKIVVDGVNYGTRYVFPNGFTEIYDLNTGVIIREAYPSTGGWGENYAELYSLNDGNLEPIPRVDTQNNAKKGISLTSGKIAIKLDNSTDNSENNWTIDTVNAYLQENPITIIYVLANPIEHDLSAYLPNSNLITLHSNGSLVFNNEYEQDVPNTITYQKEI